MLAQLVKSPANCFFFTVHLFIYFRIDRKFNGEKNSTLVHIDASSYNFEGLVCYELYDIFFFFFKNHHLITLFFFPPRVGCYFSF